MTPLGQYIDRILLPWPELAPYRERLAPALAGSRTVGYHTSVSGYDLLGLCDAATYAELARRAGHDPAVAGIDIALDRDEARAAVGVEVDCAIYEADHIRHAFREYNDTVLDLDERQALAGPGPRLAKLQSSFGGYPPDVLEHKLKQHSLRDFHLEEGVGAPPVTGARASLLCLAPGPAAAPRRLAFAPSLLPQSPCRAKMHRVTSMIHSTP